MFKVIKVPPSIHVARNFQQLHLMEGIIPKSPVSFLAPSYKNVQGRRCLLILSSFFSFFFLSLFNGRLRSYVISWRLTLAIPTFLPLVQRTECSAISPKLRHGRNFIIIFFLFILFLFLNVFHPPIYSIVEYYYTMTRLIK